MCVWVWVGVYAERKRDVVCGYVEVNRLTSAW